MPQIDFGKTTGGVKLYQDPNDPTKATATPPPTDPTVQPDQGATQNPVIRYPVSPNVADNYGAPKSFDQFTQDQNKYVSPVDEAAIRENIRKAQQARIDAINATYDTMVQKENVAGQDRLGSERAVEARGGLVGSDFGAAQKAKVVDYNAQSVNAINRQRDLEVQGVFDKIDQLTADKVKSEKLEALGKANAYVEYLGKAQTTARDAIKSAGKAGVTLDQLKSQGADKLKQLLDSTGYSEFELGMQLEANKPDPIKYDWMSMGDSIVGIGVDPMTGKPVKTVYNAKDLGVPVTPSIEFQTFDDGIYYYDKKNPERDASGNIIFKKAGNAPKDGYESGIIGEYQFYADQEKVAGRQPVSFTEYQNQDANRKLKGSSSGGGSYPDFSGSGSTGTTQPTAPKQTFEEFLAQEENKAGQSFNQAKRDDLKKQFESTKVEPTPQAQTADLSKYSFVVRQVILGNEPASSILTGGTAGERKRYQQELNDAEAKGLLKQGYSGNQEKFITTVNDSVSKSAVYSKTTSMRNYADNVSASLSLGSGVGDIAAINQFQKVIDEGAVTRDQDVKLIQESQSLMNTLKTKLKKLEKGEQLSPELRAQMSAAVKKLYNSQVKALKNDPYIKSKIKEASGHNVKPEDTILGEFDSFGTQSSNASSGGVDPLGIR